MFKRINIYFLVLLITAGFICQVQAQPAHKTNRAMWVWHSLGPQLKEEERKELFSFCEKYGINELFFQLQYVFLEDQPEIKCQIGYENFLRSFLKEAHKRKIKIHALDGYAEFVLRQNHPRVLAQVKAILEFNARGKPDERYDGIHLDNEPYLLFGFDGPLKEEILKQFLELNQKCMNLVRASGQQIVYGVDIPYWFEELDERGEVNCPVTFKGSTKATSYHIIDIVDNVGIMDYRNFAEGPDGIIGHGIDEIKYASKVGKKVYVGVETFSEEPVKLIFVYGYPKYEFNKRLTSIGGQFATRFKYKGLHIAKLSDGENIHAGLAVPSDLSRHPNFKDIFLEVCRVLGKDVYVLDKKAVDEMLFNTEIAVSNNIEYEGFNAKMIPSDRANRAYLTFETYRVTIPKTTFAGMAKSELEKNLAKAEETFKDYPGFYGFAIHYYEPYKAMREE
ncbi:MAG: hypothetical protein ABH847_03510 [Candidatus Omnitrophota bacterium]